MWIVKLKDGTELRQYNEDGSANNVKNIDVLNVLTYIYKKNEHQKIAIAIKETDKLIYFHRIVRHFPTNNLESEMIYFGTLTTLYGIEPKSGIEYRYTGNQIKEILEGTGWLGSE